MHPYNVKTLLDMGRLSVIKESAENERTKTGILRGGSTGIVTADGKNYGECPRKAYLRYKGVESQKELSVESMFASGRQNEEILLDWLQRGHSGHVFKEGDIKTSWTTSSGVLVTGTPDIGLGIDSETLEMGIEAKLVSSVWTAHNVNYKFKPDNKHLSQAAHYSMALNVPYVLVYSSRVAWHVSTMGDWAMKYYKGKQDIQHGDDGLPFKMNPFDRVYELTWGVDGRLYYHTEGMLAPQRTAITKESIERFYELVANMETSGDMGPIPSNRHVNGKDDAYRPCDYCPLKPLCAENRPIDEWTDHATNILQSESK